MLWRELKTAYYHSLMHIDHYLKDSDQCQSHNPVWCRFVCAICVVENENEVFQIIMCKLEYIVKLRPLTTSSDDPVDLKALTSN